MADNADSQAKRALPEEMSCLLVQAGHCRRSPPFCCGLVSSHFGSLEATDILRDMNILHEYNDGIAIDEAGVNYTECVSTVPNVHALMCTVGNTVGKYLLLGFRQHSPATTTRSLRGYTRTLCSTKGSRRCGRPSSMYSRIEPRPLLTEPFGGGRDPVCLGRRLRNAQGHSSRQEETGKW